jgi:hypothetical protein
MHTNKNAKMNQTRIVGPNFWTAQVIFNISLVNAEAAIRRYERIKIK